MLACEKGNLDEVKVLLEKGANPEYRCQRTLNALHYAAQGGNSEVIEHLVTTTKLDINEALRGGTTALHLAVQKKRIKAITYLLKHGANVFAKANITFQNNLSKSYRLSALGLAIFYDDQNVKNTFFEFDENFIEAALELSARNEWFDKFRVLCFAFKNIFPKRGYEDILFLLAKKGTSVEAVRILKEEFEVPLNAIDIDGHNVFHYAAPSASHDFILFLLNNTTNLFDAPAKNGYTPLHFAVARKNLLAVELLLNAGAGCTLPSPPPKRNLIELRDKVPQAQTFKGRLLTPYQMAQRPGFEKVLELFKRVIDLKKTQED